MSEQRDQRINVGHFCGISKLYFCQQNIVIDIKQLYFYQPNILTWIIFVTDIKQLYFYQPNILTWVIVVVL